MLVPTDLHQLVVVMNVDSWCNFFDVDDLKVIDYLNDIEVKT
jgi:hypothetical protein